MFVALVDERHAANNDANRYLRESESRQRKDCEDRLQVLRPKPFLVLCQLILYAVFLVVPLNAINKAYDACNASE